MAARSKSKAKSDKKHILTAVLFFLAGIFIFVCLYTQRADDHPFYSSQASVHDVRNATGIIGAYLSHYLLRALGWAAYGIPFTFIIWGIIDGLNLSSGRKLLKLSGLVIFLSATACMFYLVERPPFVDFLGGIWGYFLGTHLLRYFGLIGGSLITISLIILSLVLVTDFQVISFLFLLLRLCRDGLVLAGKGVVKLVVLLQERTERVAQSLPEKISKAKQKTEAVKNSLEAKLKRATPPPKVTVYESSFSKKRVTEDDEVRNSVEKERKKQKKVEKESTFAKVTKVNLSEIKRNKKEKIEADAKGKEEEASPEVSARPIESKRMDVAYILPGLDLLEVPRASNFRNKDILEENSKLLEDTLKDFGIDVRVTEVKQGPVVTRYEILPAPGVKVSSIVSLQDDIALALKAASVRMIAPIPGKSAVGIEVPNAVTTLVYLRELLESKEYKSGKYKLPLVLGKDVSGRNLIADLSEMPHMLVAGTTGSGKTVCINSIIAGFLYTLSPEDLRFVMIDPKMVELAVYNKLPHMLAPVVTDVRKAAATLNWVVGEMERRYKLFANVGVRNIQSFNARDKSSGAELPGGESVPEKLPYVVVIIDELADLMIAASDKVESAITRLAQLSRAVGIHLLLATQRPSVDVITGVIKANFPARISFKVASKVDSRTVLDINGADKLLGKGDMLFLQPGTAKPIRAQCALTTDKEINRVAQFISNQSSVSYVEEVERAGEGSSIGVDRLEKDELYDEAVRVILETKQASVSILQRRLRLGYTRAARIIDMMEANRIVGPYQGSKPRDILVESQPQM